MKWLKRILLTLVVLVVLVLVVGMILPSGFKVQRSIVVNAPADRIFPLLADPREWKRWAIWNQRDPAMTVEYSGAASGAGARWSWQSRTEGNGAMEFTAAVPYRHVDYALSFPDMGMNSRGVLTLAPDGDGTRVTWTNEGDMGSNPLNRYFGLMMDSMVGPDFDAGLKNLKALAERG
ncbi:MAG TPA: SRPBCC family protein [Burkholderiaceae bacterium]|nr:SRPBCC family protein [Burkholderiaceae bacterium]